MKQVKFAVAAALLMTMVAADAKAEDAKQPESHVILTAVDTSTAGADVKIAPLDYPNGVFVRVKEMFSDRPVSSSIFAAKLKSHGFTIAESADKADAIFTIRSSTINFKDIDENSDSVSANKVDAVAGIAITAVVTGGLSLLSADYSALSNSKPIYQDMVVKIEPTKAGSEEKVTGMTGATKADSRNAKVTRAFFDLMADEWLKAHLRNDDAAVPAEPSGTNVVTKQ